jgi:hypothetical protein
MIKTISEIVKEII